MLMHGALTQECVSVQQEKNEAVLRALPTESKQ